MEKITSGSKVSEKVAAHCQALFRAPQFYHLSGLEKQGIILFALRLSMLDFMKTSLKFPQTLRTSRILPLLDLINDDSCPEINQ